MTILRKLLIALPVALGLVAAVSGPASAGMVLNNHCLPQFPSSTPHPIPTPLES